MDAGHLVVLDGLCSEGERQELLEWLTAPGWDHSGPPPGDKWELACVDRPGEQPTWGLRPEVRGPAGAGAHCCAAAGGRAGQGWAGRALLVRSVWLCAAKAMALHAAGCTQQLLACVHAASSCAPGQLPLVQSHRPPSACPHCCTRQTITHHHALPAALQMLTALQRSPPSPMVALQSRLASLYPEWDICHMPAAALGQEYDPDDEEDGPLSSFVGNAVMYGDSCQWHADADPASLPPQSPWVQQHGYYYNREPGGWRVAGAGGLVCAGLALWELCLDLRALAGLWCIVARCWSSACSHHKHHTCWQQLYEQ